MDSEVKRELLAAAPSIILPLVRAGVDHRFTMKQIEKREELAIQKAERQNEGIRAMTRAKGGGHTVGQTEPVTLDSPGDVYDELASLKQETNCRFCREAANALIEEAPPDEARQGYDELRSYVREVERLSGNDITEAKAKQVVDELVSSWSVVPRYLSGFA